MAFGTQLGNALMWYNINKQQHISNYRFWLLFNGGVGKRKVTFNEK